jgi:hypothetical protein
VPFPIDLGPEIMTTLMLHTLSITPPLATAPSRLAMSTRAR